MLSALRWICLFVMIGLTTNGLAHTFRARGATLVVNGVQVFTFANVGNITGAERASYAAQVLSTLGGELNVGTEALGDVTKIHVAKKDVCTITSQDLKADGVDSQEVAWRVSEKIKSALALPPIRVSQNLVQMGTGKEIVLDLQGSELESLRVTSTNESVAQAQLQDFKIRLKGVRAGNSIVSLTTRSVQSNVGVVVRNLALITPQTTIAAVTGSPASVETVRGAIESAVKRGLTAAPDADIRIVEMKPSMIDRGNSNTFAVKVQAFAPDCFPAEGTVQVTVFNLGISRKEDQELWYCNIPERLSKPGPVFSSSLVPDRPVRMLYHHVNDTKSLLYFNVQVVNNSELPAKILVIHGDGRPVYNPVAVGAEAGTQYLRKYRNASGEVVTIPPRMTLPVSIRGLYPQQVASGLCSLRLLEGGPDQVLVRADAREPFNVTASWAAAMHSDAPWRLAGTTAINDFDTPAGAPSEFIFPNPAREYSASYVVGNPFTFIRMGHDPIARKDNGEVLDGNYGVIYTINTKVINPTNTTAQVELVFEASAGYATALFLMNGQEVKSEMLKPHGEFRLAVLTVKPGETRKFSFTTLPLSGSAYPATLTFRPLGSTVKYGEIYGKKKKDGDE